MALTTVVLFQRTYLRGFTTYYIVIMTDDIAGPISDTVDGVEHQGALAARFWSKVKVRAADECWEWTRSRRNVAGEDYGQFRWTPPGWDHSTVMAAHRVAYYLTNGHLPRVACHHCDNPPCCNPAHIYSGTHATNGIDKARRGRGRGKSDQRGEANDSAVLTDAVVLEARRRARAGGGITAIARDLGVPRPSLNYAVLGRTWTHLDADEPPILAGTGKRNGKLTQAQIAEIVAAAGTTVEEVAARYGITVSAVYYHWRRHGVATPLRNRRRSS